MIVVEEAAAVSRINAGDGQDMVLMSTSPDGKADGSKIHHHVHLHAGASGESNWQQVFAGCVKPVSHVAVDAGLIGAAAADAFFSSGVENVIGSKSDDTTDFDADQHAQGLIIKESSRKDLKYSERVSRLKNGQAGITLDASTVHDDGVKDILFGETELDWFWLDDQDVSDMESKEKKN